MAEERGLVDLSNMVDADIAEQPAETVEETMDDAVETALFDELAAKPLEEVKIEDLRRFKGTEDLTDEELQAQYKEARAPEAKPDDVAGKADTPSRSWKFYDAKGQEIKDLSKLTAEEFLRGQIGYRALNADQRKAFDEVIRVTQLGHLNERKLGSMQQQLQDARAQLNEALKQTNLTKAEKRAWREAVNDAIGERKDTAKLEKLLALPEDAVQEDDPVAASQAEAAGIKFYYEHVRPATDALAAELGLDKEQVAEKAMHWFGREAAYLTPQRIQDILTVELPEELRLERTKPDPAASKIAELEREIASLKSSTAQAHNTKVKSILEKKRKAAPSVSGAASEADVTMPSFKNAQDAKSWLRA